MRHVKRSLLMTLFAAGCFSDAPEDDSPCNPGAQVSCDCLKGDGVQVCRMSGIGYEPCQCGEDETGGGTTSGGMTSTSGPTSTTGRITDAESSAEGTTTTPGSGSEGDPTGTDTTNGGTTAVDSDTTTGTTSTDIVINEIVHDPVPGEEDWIELYNRGAEAVDVSDWLISDGGNFFPIPQGTIIAPDEYLVYTRNEPGSFTWGFGDDEIVVLYDAQDDPVDSADWGLGEAVQPDSLGRLPNGAGDFQELTPTKGEENQ
jgi:hypothetical protein